VARIGVPKASRGKGGAGGGVMASDAKRLRMRTLRQAGPTPENRHRGKCPGAPLALQAVRLQQGGRLSHQCSLTVRLQPSQPKCSFAV
jgi:hypothetical protein